MQTKYSLCTFSGSVVKSFSEVTQAIDYVKTLNKGYMRTCYYRCILEVTLVYNDKQQITDYKTKIVYYF